MGIRKKTVLPALAEDELSKRPLQAVLLADSFDTKFHPITLERPKVLLPLLNIPMINYTLAWLESAGVEEVFILCCAHSRQVIDYLEESEWYLFPRFSITLIESQSSLNVGDALRLIYERNVIHGDFVLLFGDTISNLSLTQALLEHKERRKRDSNVVMTMIIQQSKLCKVTKQSRHGTDELLMAINTQTKQLLYYEEGFRRVEDSISLDPSLLEDASVSIHNDMQDCYIDICSQEVLSLFADNFDYQHLRHHFVKGILVDDIMGYKIFVHEIETGYAARVDNYRSYDTISKDIMQRWSYPFVPDVNFCGISPSKLQRNGIYQASEIDLSHSAQVGPFVMIGEGTKIGDNTKIMSSVIGKGCKIGSNALITDSYLWEDVVIGDHCQLRHVIVCDKAILRPGSVADPGAVLSFKVVIGNEFVVPSYSKVSLLQEPNDGDSCVDETGDDLVAKQSQSTNRLSSQVGHGGCGYLWSIQENDETWKHSIAPIPLDKFSDAVTDNDLKATVDTRVPMHKDDVHEETEDAKSDTIFFEEEVEATFLRAVNENIGMQDINLEMNSLRLSYNKTSADCAGMIFYSMMKYALENAPSPGELCKSVATVVNKWKDILRPYGATIDDQIEIILKFEEMCLESTPAFSSYFSEILYILYDEDVLMEEAVLSWADEKADADESDKVFVEQSQNFIRWLKEAPEED